MKRDPDLEREILLAIEAYDGESAPGYADLSHLHAPQLQVDYHVVLLDTHAYRLTHLLPRRHVGTTGRAEMAAEDSY